MGFDSLKYILFYASYSYIDWNVYAVGSLKPGILWVKYIYSTYYNPAIYCILTARTTTSSVGLKPVQHEMYDASNRLKGHCKQRPYCHNATYTRVVRTTSTSDYDNCSALSLAPHPTSRFIYCRVCGLRHLFEFESEHVCRSGFRSGENRGFVFCRFCGSRHRFDTTMDHVCQPVFPWSRIDGF